MAEHIAIFFRDIRREWSYSPPSRYPSRVWIRIWQDWNRDSRRDIGPAMKRYVMILLFLPDLCSRTYWALLGKSPWAR